MDVMSPASAKVYIGQSTRTELADTGVLAAMPFAGTTARHPAYCTCQKSSVSSPAVFGLLEWITDMHRTNVTLTTGLHAVLQSIAEARGANVAPEIERLLWQSKEVRAAAKAMGIEQQKRRGVGDRGKDKPFTVRKSRSSKK
jgi:hypothetical protein